MRESWHGCLSFRIVLRTKCVGSMPIKGLGLMFLRVLSMCANSKGTKFCHCTVESGGVMGGLPFGIAIALRIMVLALRI